MRRISDARLVVLLRGWDQLPGRKAERLAAAVGELLVSQELPYGSILPAERRLATSLGTSRTTVADAYGLLRGWGVLESRQGSGSRLRRPGPGLPALDSGVEDEGRLDSYSDRARQVIDFSSGALPGLALVAEQWADLTSTYDLGALLTEDGYLPYGMPELREGIAGLYSAQGVPTVGDEILITSGSQQALEILARTWLDPGESVIVEDPSYRGALEVFRNREARIFTVPMEPDGPDVDVLERITRNHTPRFVYLLPTAHNPTGVTMSASKRAVVRDLAGSRGLILIEDTSPADLVFDPARTPRPLLAGADPSIAIGIGSLSKLFWGGLRVGWIRAPRSVVSALGKNKRSMDLGSSLVSQVLALRLLPQMDAARALRRQQLTTGRAALERELITHLPEWSWPAPAGGGALWVRAPGIEAADLARRVTESGVTVVPGSTYSAVGGYRDHLRLPFVHVEDIEPAIAVITATWRAMTR